MPTITEINPQVGDVIEFRSECYRNIYAKNEYGLKSELGGYLDSSYFYGSKSTCDKFHVVSRAKTMKTEEKQMEHTYKAGDWVEALVSSLGVTKGKKYQIKSVDETLAPLDFIDDNGDWGCFYLKEVKSVVSTIQVGEAYTTNNNQSITILVKHDDFYVGLFSYGSLCKFNEDGTCVDIPSGDYNVDWGTVIEEVRLDEGFTCVNNHYIYFEDHSVSVTTIDGEPDWTTLAVETKD